MGDKKTCFVVMGYGEKTDFETGRKLNLDKTYTAIIKPAVEDAQVECIRADEVQHSGVIDLHMYKHLLEADVVVADLSTSNCNAFYELGVRHALRPHTTIVIAEKELKAPFDVKSVVIRRYEHLGRGIDYDEVMRARAELANAIRVIVGDASVDSPVYTFLADLEPPKKRVAQAQDAARAAVAAAPAHTGESIGAMRNAVESAKAAGDWTLAKNVLQALLTIVPQDTWTLQQTGLASYKLGDAARKKGDAPAALALYREAHKHLLALRPDATADGESLGLWAGLCKRLYELEVQVDPAQRAAFEAERAANLDQAIAALQKGFLILNDSYNGINLAYMLDSRAAVSTGNEAIADAVQARRTRRKLIPICESELAPGKKLSDDDRYWLLATLEEAYVGLGDAAKAEETGRLAKAAARQPWMRQSTEEQIAKLRALRAKVPI